MKSLLPPLLWLACSALFLGGCSSYDKNIVTVGLRVELTKIERASDGTVSVAWHIVNPNVTPYLLARVANRIYLNGTLVGTTLDTNAIAIPAQTTTGKATTLTPASPAAQLITAAAAQGHADYRVETALTVQLYGEQTDDATLVNSGSVPVSTK
jgi:hypothetical protein